MAEPVARPNRRRFWFWAAAALLSVVYWVVAWGFVVLAGLSFCYGDKAAVRACIDAANRAMIETAAMAVAIYAGLAILVWGLVRWGRRANARRDT